MGAALDDDVAVWPAGDGTFTVGTCDTFVEGRHFDLGWMPAADAGWRACALTLADLAAKGARPTYGLASLLAPPDLPVEVVEDLYRGLKACADESGLRLVGGDTAAADVLGITLFVLGQAEREPLPRSAVQPGWVVGVTGPLGGEAAALAQRRPTRPRPWFRAPASDEAVGDISDGLLRELAKFRLGAAIRSSSIPVAEGATLEQALTGGEEMQFVVGWPGGDRPLFVIGHFTEDPRILVDGEEREGGYDHFA